VDKLIKQLQERRARLIERRNAQVTIAEASIACSSETEKTAYGAAMTEIRKINADELAPLDAELTAMTEQHERDRRAAELRARTGDTGADNGAAGGRASVGSEPTIYGEYSGHSYFLDLCRVKLGQGDGDGGLQAARDRQDRHQAELRVEMPKREALAERTANRELEHRLSGADLEDGSRRERHMARAERRALERAQALGVPMYEKRIISRTDGQGGYEVPPLWLVDQIIPYLRAGRTFADLWHNFPLPAGTDSINIPRFVVGTATGTQPGDGAPVTGRDAQDNFVQARVMTVAGQEDAAMQLLDQSPLNYDDIVIMDLAADYNMQVSAQLMLGSGFPQLSGMYQTGVLYGNGSLGTAGPTNSGHYAIANGLTTNQFIGNPGTTFSMYTASGQLKSKIGRTRFLPPTAWVGNPAVWEAMSTATDGNNRPIIVPDQNGPFNAVAISGASAVEGVQGRYLSLPMYTDPNIPLTFGGTSAVQPSIGAISNGHTAPTDGSGGTSTNANVFTPLIAARWDDLFFWEGTFRTRVLTEVLSGNLAVRFQGYAYCASMPNRYQDASGNLVSYGNVNSIGALGAALSQGAAGGLVGF
jgi:HK97 family phage major capsid protein